MENFFQLRKIGSIRGACTVIYMKGNASLALIYEKALKYGFVVVYTT